MNVEKRYYRRTFGPDHLRSVLGPDYYKDQYYVPYNHPRFGSCCRFLEPGEEVPEGTIVYEDIFLDDDAADAKIIELQKERYGYMQDRDFENAKRLGEEIERLKRCR